MSQDYQFLTCILLQTVVISIFAVAAYGLFRRQLRMRGNIYLACSCLALLAPWGLALLPIPSWMPDQIQANTGLVRSRALLTRQISDRQRSSQVSGALALEAIVDGDSQETGNNSLGLAIWNNRRVSAVLIAVVGIIVCVSLLRLAIAFVWVHRILNRAKSVQSELVWRPLRKFQQELGLSRRIAVLETVEIDSPATVGWLRPVILLPSTWRQWSVSDLAAVMAHEVSHLRHGDFFWHVLCRTSAALNGFNPLAWLLSNWFCSTAELRADREAVRLLGNDEHYIASLASIALARDGSVGAPSISLTFFSKDRGILRRIEMLKGSFARNSSTLPQWLATGMIVICTGLISGIRPAKVEAAPQDEPIQVRRLGTDEDGDLYEAADSKEAEEASMAEPVTESSYAASQAMLVLRHYITTDVNVPFRAAEAAGNKEMCSKLIEASCYARLLTMAPEEQAHEINDVWQVDQYRPGGAWDHVTKAPSMVKNLVLGHVSEGQNKEIARIFEEGRQRRMQPYNDLIARVHEATGADQKAFREQYAVALKLLHQQKVEAYRALSSNSPKDPAEDVQTVLAKLTLADVESDIAKVKSVLTQSQRREWDAIVSEYRRLVKSTLDGGDPLKLTP